MFMAQKAFPLNDYRISQLTSRDIANTTCNVLVWIKPTKSRRL